MSTNLENFLKLVSKEQSKWLEDAKFRKENRYWIKTSQKIALKILSRFDELNIDKFELSNKTNIPLCTISKMVKGFYNFNLIEIRKIEIALDMKIVEINF